MWFNTEAEARAAIAAINDELQLRFHFVGKILPATAEVLEKTSRSRTFWKLDTRLWSVACNIPCHYVVTYLKPTTDLGTQAFEYLHEHYPMMAKRPREKEAAATEQGETRRGRRKTK